LAFLPCVRALARTYTREGEKEGEGGREGEREKFYVKTTVKCARSRRTRGVALHRACTCQPFRRISTRSPLYHPLHPRLRVHSDFFRVSDRICANDDAMISRPVARARYTVRARVSSGIVSLVSKRSIARSSIARTIRNRRALWDNPRYTALTQTRRRSATILHITLYYTLLPLSFII